MRNWGGKKASYQFQIMEKLVQAPHTSLFDRWRWRAIIGDKLQEMLIVDFIDRVDRLFLNEIIELTQP